MKYLIIFWLSVVILTACTRGAEISEKSLNKVMVCTDTRDGEVFKFNTNTLINIRVGTNNRVVSANFTDIEGQFRVYSPAMEMYIKCVEEK